MTKTGFVAVNKVESQGAGAIVWWKINGYTECEALDKAWEQRVDLDPELLMNRPTPGAALRRALASQVRTTKEGKVTLSSLGEENAYALVRETVSGFDSEPEHTTLLKVRLVKGANDEVSLEMLVHPAAPKGLGNEVASDYQRNLDTFSGTEISSWFSMVVLPAFNAVSLRDQGGMWFVPATHLDLWYQAVAAVREVSGHQVFKIPALSTEAEAVAGILDAIACEALKAAQDVEDEILSTEMSATKLKNRVAKMDAVTAKVTAYETMLGANLETIRARLEGLNAQMAAAIFTAEAAKDATEEAA